MSNYSSKIASHPDSKAIISRLLAGEHLKSIAKDFGFHPSTLSQFRQRILKPAALGLNHPGCKEVGQYCKEGVHSTKSLVPALIAQTSTADLVARKLGRYERILDKAEKAGELGNWASVDRAETAALQLQAQLRGEVNQVHTQTTVQMMVYTPQVHEAEEVAEAEVLEACAVETIDAPVEPPPPVKQPKPKKPPKPPSRIKQLQALSAAERKQAIRLIGQGLDPFAAAPDLPE